MAGGGLPGAQPPLVHLSAGWDWNPRGSDPRFQDLLRRMNFPP
jgi:hypothetical protein